MSQRTARRPAARNGLKGAVSRHQLTLAEHACLTAAHQGTRHGWAIGTLLAPDGEIGRIWSLTRPLTYRAIDSLVERRLLTRRGTQAGPGRERTILHVTAAGIRAVESWLDTPVEHLRDVRTELLVKLTFRQRAGLELVPLLNVQQELFSSTIDELTTASSHDDLVDLWRRESSRAVRRFLDDALHPDRIPAHKREGATMRLSARNQLTATVADVTHGEVMSTVKVTLPDGQQLTAAITKDAAVDLDIASGDSVLVIIKSTEVMIAKPD
ncbi:MAG: TOBE domain-containing protein [Actinomycetota bacterium]|nr:TOBE domain-containing protein [Actinomycetota bacterium]